MVGWPAIGEPELLARLAMPDEEFLTLAMSWAHGARLILRRITALREMR
jgi:hypothetical protein